MMRAAILAAAAMLAATPAQAWFRGTTSGGAGDWSHASATGDRSTSYDQGSWAHNADHGYQDRSSSGQLGQSASRSVQDGGVTRESTVSQSGWAHTSDYGGYTHSTSGNYDGTATHTGYYGTTTATGAYYHKPVAPSYYGVGGCHGCATALRPPVYGAPAAPAYGAAAGGSPPGCEYRPLLRRYVCPGGAAYVAAYGANGVYYTPAPP